MVVLEKVHCLPHLGNIFPWHGKIFHRKRFHGRVFHSSNTVHLLLFLAVVISACQQYPDTNSAKDLSTVPSVTGAVLTTSNTYQDPFNPYKVAYNPYQGDFSVWRSFGETQSAARYGIVLSSITASTFGSSQSGALCKITDVWNKFLKEISPSDLLACYLKLLDRNRVVNLSYNSEAYIQFLTGSSQTPRIKYYIERSGDNTITDLKIYACFNTVFQDEYIRYQKTSNGTVLLTAVGTHSDGKLSATQRTVVSGTVDSVGRWLSGKTISYQGVHTSTVVSFEQKQKLSLVWQPNTFTLGASFTGSYQSESHSGRIYAISEIIDADSLSTLGIGNGVAKYQMSLGSTVPASVQSWDADTQLPLSDATKGDHYTTVSSSALADVQSIAAAFEAGETWNCSLGDDLSTVDMNVFQNGGPKQEKDICDQKYTFTNSVHLPCKNVTW